MEKNTETKLIAVSKVILIIFIAIIFSFLCFSCGDNCPDNWIEIKNGMVSFLFSAKDIRAIKLADEFHRFKYEFDKKEFKNFYDLLNNSKYNEKPCGCEMTEYIIITLKNKKVIEIGKSKQNFVYLYKTGHTYDKIYFESKELEAYIKTK